MAKDESKTFFDLVVDEKRDTTQVPEDPPKEKTPLELALEQLARAAHTESPRISFPMPCPSCIGGKCRG